MTNRWWENMKDYPSHDNESGKRPFWGGFGNSATGDTDKKWPGWGNHKNDNNESDSESTGSTEPAPTPNLYIESDAVKALRQQMEQIAAQKPGAYVSQWQPQLDAMANSILNRKDFSYDLNADALYQQYKDRYVNLGQQAMMDTMGQAAALTGGYGNSAAQMVGQQAYQSYLQGLTDKIPELYQMALDQYNQQGQDLYQRYGLLNTQEQAAYDKWLGDYNRWLSERDFSTGRYDTERGFDYGTHRDTVSDAQWKEELAAQERQWQAQLQLQREQFEWEKAMAMQESSGDAGGGGGYYGGSGGGGGGGGYGAGYEDALLLVNYAADTQSQENVIRNAAEKGLITKAGAQELIKLVGNTQYTK